MMNGLLDSPGSLVMHLLDILKKQNSKIILSLDLTNKHVVKLCVDRKTNLVTETATMYLHTEQHDHKDLVVTLH